jgi:hypothetical protein
MLLLGASLTFSAAPVAASVCGSVGGAHVDVSGCSDPLSELNDVYPPPPPPPPDAAPPPPPAYVPPPPPPDVDVCASAGKRVTVSGCV